MQRNFMDSNKATEEIYKIYVKEFQIAVGYSHSFTFLIYSKRGTYLTERSSQSW